MPIRSDGGTEEAERRVPVCHNDPVLELAVSDNLQRLLVKEDAPIFLVLDGHPVHRSRAVGTFVKATEGRLRIFFLPGYSPELNPDEQVWNHVKHHGIGKMALESRKDLARRAKSRLYSLQRRPEVIRSFFQLDGTRYAA